MTAGTLRANNGGYFTNGGLGTGPITLQSGGTMDAAFSGGNSWDFLNPIDIPSGQIGNINTPNRFEMKGAVTGSGTLNMNIITGVTRADFRNNFTAFSGNLNFTGSGTMRLRINQSGSAFNGASFTDTNMNLGDSVGAEVVTNSGGNTLPIGALSGNSATAFLGGGSNGAATYSVGGLGTDTTFAGGIRGNARLTKAGSGTLTLTNSTILDYTGATNVDAGILKINGTKTGGGVTTVKIDTTLTGTGSIAGTTTVQNGGILAPGDGGVGNITLSNLTLDSGSILDVEFGSGNDTATVASGGTLTLASGATVAVNGFSTDGTYTIINTTGAVVSGAVATSLSAVGGSGSKIYTFSDTGTAIQMTISSSDPSNFWKVVTIATATLGGNGNIGGNVTIQSTGRHALAVAATPGAQVTRVISGTLNLDAGNILALTAAAPPAAGTYILATASSITGTPTTINYNGITGTVEVVGGNSLVLTAAGASGYSSWASLNGASENPNEDHDNDGVSNGVEYFIGGPNGNTAGFTPLPGVTTVAGVRSVTWTYGPGYTGTYGSGFSVQSSNTLAAGSWNIEASPGTVSINMDARTVTYTFPAGPLRSFARLVVTP